MIRQTLGWSSRIARPASRRRRSTELLSVASLGESTLIATSCPVETSFARYTYDIPPSPSFFSTWYRASSICPERLAARSRPLEGWGGVRTPVPLPVDEARAGAALACTSTSMLPSRGQKRAVSAYTDPHLGQRRSLIAAPSCAPRSSPDRGPGPPARRSYRRR